MDLFVNILVVLAGVATMAGVSLAVVELRVKAIEKRVENHFVASEVLQESGRVAVRLVEQVIQLSDVQSGLIHRLLVGRSDEIDPGEAMGSVAAYSEALRASSAQLLVMFGDERERREAATNLAGGSASVRLRNVLQVAVHMHPNDDRVREALNTVDVQLR